MKERHGGGHLEIQREITLKCTLFSRRLEVNSGPWCSRLYLNRSQKDTATVQGTASRGGEKGGKGRE